jgi:hypothetical protein
MVITQVTASVSLEDLLIVLNVVRQSIAPPDAALNIPASVTAPVASPASKLEV